MPWWSAIHDNGPELVSLTLAQWAEEFGVLLEFIKPGKAMQNAFAERLNRTYRTEILDFYLFSTLNEAREITERWQMEYNSERPHESLNNLTPEEYRLMLKNLKSQKMCGTKTGMFTPCPNNLWKLNSTGHVYRRTLSVLRFH